MSRTSLIAEFAANGWINPLNHEVFPQAACDDGGGHPHL